MEKNTPEAAILDDELISLLKKTKKEPIETSTKTTEQVKQKKEIQTTSVPAEITKPVQVTPEPVLIPKPVPDMLATNLTTPSEGPQDELNIKAILLKFSSSLDSILENIPKDRNQIEGTIQLVETQIKAAMATPDKRIPSVLVEALVRLLQTKAEVNTNATMVLDSITKLLSAGKKNELMVSIGAKTGELDLVKLLTQPKREDEGSIKK